MDESLYDIFEDRTEFGNSDDLFAILESLEDFTDFPLINQAEAATPKENEVTSTSRLVSQKSTSSLQDSETELETEPKRKRQKLTPTLLEEQINSADGQQRVSHITVERNRRKQMNEHLSVLRSLMPCFYVKRVSVYLFLWLQKLILNIK